jgi:hypothetical protein
MNRTEHDLNPLPAAIYHAISERPEDRRKEELLESLYARHREALEAVETMTNPEFKAYARIIADCYLRMITNVQDA